AEFLKNPNCCSGSSGGKHHDITVTFRSSLARGVASWKRLKLLQRLNLRIWFSHGNIFRYKNTKAESFAMPPYRQKKNRAQYRQQHSAKKPQDFFFIIQYLISKNKNKRNNKKG